MFSPFAENLVRENMFCRGLARGLGVHEDYTVASPTFTLVNEYPGRCRLYHFDVYRLNHPQSSMNWAMMNMYREAVWLLLSGRIKSPMPLPPEAVIVDFAMLMKIQEISASRTGGKSGTSLEI